MNYQQKGFTLIEAVIATAIVVITTMGLSMFNAHMAEQNMNIMRSSEYVKILNLIDRELYEDMDYLPYRYDPDVNFIYSNTNTDIKFENLVNSFNSSAFLYQTCYSKMGIKVSLTDVECDFKVEYYKVGEIDRLYSSSATSFNNSPLSRLVYRVFFKDVSSKYSSVYYFTRVKSNVPSL